jgi:hypothetical protein
MFLLGQGWLIVGSLLHGNLTNQKEKITLLQEIPLILLSGLIINYGIVLCFQSLKTSLLVGWIISIFGIFYFTKYIFRNHAQWSRIASSMNNWIGVFFLCLLYLSPILTEPLKAWDARSIWFFHAKMIYVAKSIGLAAGWQHPSAGFSHIAYPILVPTLSAQIAYTMGFWNEYIPKASLFFMFIPAVAWLFTFTRRSLSFMVLLLLIPFSYYLFLWNGYMDGLLGLYLAIAMLLLGRFIRSSQLIDLVSSLVCLIVLLNIKNEGSLAALIGFFLMIPVEFLNKKPYLLRNIFLTRWRYYLASLIVFLLPFALWTFYKQSWNISNGLEIGSVQSLSRIFGRLTDGSYKIIFQRVYEQIEVALLLLGLLYFASIAWNYSFHLVQESIPALAMAGMYGLGMIVFYLQTPHDLDWHLNTSLHRVMLSVNGCIFVGCYYILDEIEKRKYPDNLANIE